MRGAAIYGAMRGTVGKYVEYGRVSRVRISQPSDAACAPMRIGKDIAPVAALPSVLLESLAGKESRISRNLQHDQAELLDGFVKVCLGRESG